MTDDAALCARAAAGDDGAFTLLIARHEVGVRGFLQHLTGGDGGEDLAQETFLRAWQGVGQFRGRSSVRTWLCAIGWRLFLDRRRRDLVRQRTHAAIAAPAPDACDPVLAIDLARALASLSDRERAALILMDGHGWTQAEAADLLALPLGTLKHLVTRARAKCRAILEDDPG